MQNKITIRAYKIETELKMFGERATNTDLIILHQTVSLENIQRAMKLLGFDEIYTVQEGDGWGSDKVLYKHPKLTEIDNRLLAEKEARYAALRKKAEDFNKLPVILKTWQFTNGYEIRLERDGIAEFNPKNNYERISQACIREHLYKDNIVQDKYGFEVSRYISENGKVLRKSFINWNSEIPETTINEMLSKFKEINEAYKQLRREWF